MTELSREQVEALARVLMSLHLRYDFDEWDSLHKRPIVGCNDAVCLNAVRGAEAVLTSDWLAAMLDEARAEGGDWETEHDRLCARGKFCSAHKPGFWPPLMLARAEGAAAVVRDVEAVLERTGYHPLKDWIDKALVRHTSAAAGAPLREAMARGWAEGAEKAARPADTRTAGCCETRGDMRCQLRAGHDGDHEDWSQV